MERVFGVIATNLFPLVDISDKSGEAQQPKKAEHFGEAENSQRSPRLEIRIDILVVLDEDEEDVVERN